MIREETKQLLRRVLASGELDGEEACCVIGIGTKNGLIVNIDGSDINVIYILSALHFNVEHTSFRPRATSLTQRGELMATDLALLFSTDPLHLTNENIDEAIAYLRSARARYLEGDKKAGNPSDKKPKAKAEKRVKEAKPAIDLNELDI